MNSSSNQAEADARTVGEVMDDPSTSEDAREALLHNIQVRAINREMTLGEVRQVFAIRESRARRSRRQPSALGARLILALRGSNRNYFSTPLAEEEER